MRISVRLAFAVLAMFAAASMARAASPSAQDAWFARATGLDAPGPVKHIESTDFLCGKTFRTMCKDEFYGDPNPMLEWWGLCKYDHKHGIGLARSSTDQEGYSLFSAPPPPGMTIPDSDLSKYATGRGLHIGSTYADVLKLYGPPVKHGERFVTSYGADDTVHYQGKAYKQPETITLVIDHGRVSAISINIEIFEP